MTRKSCIPILVVYFLYSISLTIVLPAFPSLLFKSSEDFYARDNNNNNDVISISIIPMFTNDTNKLLTNTTLIYKDQSIKSLSTSKVQASSRASLLYGIASFIKYSFEFFSSPLLGTLSDTYGRKPILLLSLFAFCLEFLILALYPSVLSVFITRGLSGLLDSTTSNVHTIVTDIAYYNNESVTKTFGSIGAAFGLGFIIGPAVGSYLASISLQLCFFVAGCVGLLAFFVSILLIEETNMNLRMFSARRANPLLAIKFFLSNKLIAKLSIPYAISHINTGIYFIWFLYMQTRLQASIVDIGLFLSASGMMVAVVQGILVQLIIPKIWSDERACVCCLGLACLQMLSYGFANNIISFYFVMILFAPTSMYGPALKSLIVKAAYGKFGVTNIENNDQIDEAGQGASGALQGALGSVRTLTAAFGSILFTSVFSFSMNRIKYDTYGDFLDSISFGLVFFIASGFYFVAFIYMNHLLDKYQLDAVIGFFKLSRLTKHFDSSSDANNVISTTSSMDEEYKELGLARISPKRRSDFAINDFPVLKIGNVLGLGIASLSDESLIGGDNEITVINPSSIKKRDKSIPSNIDINIKDNEQLDERVALLPKNKKSALKYSGDENDNNTKVAGRWIYLRKDIRSNGNDK